MTQTDVANPIDLKNMAEAQEWERAAMQRPFREEFFAAITAEVALRHRPGLRILELGSGPGFLAEYLLSRMRGVHYTLLDFSAAMHELARRRLRGASGSDIQYLERSFKENGWTEGLAPVDMVVTVQAVHELRHKRHAPAFFRQVHDLLKPEGPLLYCDHYYGDDGMNNNQLYMSRPEQREALTLAGYDVSELMVKGGRALYRARCLSSESVKE